MTIDLNTLASDAEARGTQSATDLLGDILVGLKGFVEDPSIPSHVKANALAPLAGQVQSLAEGGWAHDRTAVAGAFSTGLVPVGATALSSNEVAAIQAAMNGLGFVGSREEFFVGLGRLVGELKANSDTLQAANDQHIERIRQLEEDWATGGDAADPDSWASVAEDRDKLKLMLRDVDDVLGIDHELSGNLKADVESAVTAKETAAKATVPSIDDAGKEALRQEGAKVIIDAVKPYVTKTIKAAKVTVERGDKDKTVGDLITQHGEVKQAEVDAMKLALSL